MTDVFVPEIIFKESKFTNNYIYFFKDFVLLKMSINESYKELNKHKEYLQEIVSLFWERLYKEKGKIIGLEFMPLKIQICKIIDYNLFANDTNMWEKLEVINKKISPYTIYSLLFWLYFNEFNNYYKCNKNKKCKNYYDVKSIMIDFLNYIFFKASSFRIFDKKTHIIQTKNEQLRKLQEEQSVISRARALGGQRRADGYIPAKQYVQNMYFKIIKEDKSLDIHLTELSEIDVKNQIFLKLIDRNNDTGNILNIDSEESIFHGILVESLKHRLFDWIKCLQHDDLLIKD